MINDTTKLRGACFAPTTTTYPGGKNSVYHHIINQIPPHRVYIEGFYGSGAIMRRKFPAKLNIGVDLDASVLPGSIVKNGDASARTAVSSEMTMGAAAAIVKNDDTRCSSKTAMPDPIDRNDDTYRHAINDDASSYTFILANALDFLASCHFRGDEFVYLDPPYLMSTRKSKRDLYRHEFGSVDEHAALLSLIRSLPCMVAISGYWSELYADMLHDWRSYLFQAHTRQGMETEWLWMNYQEPIALHDYSYLGDNFRERERIKRKAKRWVNRFLSLDVLERRAIVSELKASGAIARNGETAVHAGNLS